MLNAEMQIVRFENSDILTTSGAVVPHTDAQVVSGLSTKSYTMEQDYGYINGLSYRDPDIVVYTPDGTVDEPWAQRYECDYLIAGNHFHYVADTDYPQSYAKIQLCNNESHFAN